MHRMAKGTSNIKNAARIGCEESRRTSHGIPELVFVIAEKLYGECQFFERSSWDLMRAKVPATAQWRITVSAEFPERTDSVQEPQHMAQAARFGSRRPSVLGITPTIFRGLIGLSTFGYTRSRYRRVTLAAAKANRPRDSPLNHKGARM